MAQECWIGSGRAEARAGRLDLTAAGVLLLSCRTGGSHAGNTTAECRHPCCCASRACSAASMAWRGARAAAGHTRPQHRLLRPLELLVGDGAEPRMARRQHKEMRQPS